MFLRDYSLKEPYHLKRNQMAYCDSNLHETKNALVAHTHADEKKVEKWTNIIV